MKPIHTTTSNFVYVGPPGVGDLHCDRVAPGIIQSTWRPTSDERAAIADGAAILLTLFAEPIPPVSLTVVADDGVGEDAPEVAARLAEWAGKAAADK